MRKLFIVCAVAIIALGMIAAPASATFFLCSSELARADCDGYAINAVVYHPAGPTPPASGLSIVWEVTLFDESDTVVTTASGWVSVNYYPNQTSHAFGISGPWGMELCGTYHATAYIKLIVDSTGAILQNCYYNSAHCYLITQPATGCVAQEYLFTSGLIDCDCGVCTRTQGYWKNHPGAWPVSSITVGGVSYTVAQAIDVMKTPGPGDKTYDMFRQLVAAMLNQENGANVSCISAAIASANAWFVSNPVGSGVSADSAAWQDAASAWHDSLDDYNNGLLGCADHCEDGDNGPGPNSAVKPAKVPKIKNFPNPFNPTTTLEFTLPEAGFARVEIYNMLGERIDTLVERSFQAGTHTVEWDASRYATGTYFYRLTTANHSVVQKILFVK